MNAGATSRRPASLESRPRIGIDVKTLSVHGAGISVALRAVLPELVERTPEVEWVAFAPAEALGQIPPGIRQVPIELVRGARSLRLPIYDQWQLRLAARRWRLRVLYSPYFDVPVHTGVPTVVTVHDAVHLRSPGLYPWKARAYWRLLQFQVARSAAVITDSAFSRDELLRLTEIDPRRLHVVPLAVPVPFRRPAAGPDPEVAARLRLPPRYVLYSGGVEPRKNVVRLLSAYARWRQKRGAVPALALTGPVARYDVVGPDIDRLGVRESLWFLGRVADDDMPAVYASADMVVYPSLYEGFGLPLLEAMAAGVPIACSNRGALPEVGGDAARFFDPESDTAIADALDELASDAALRSRLVAAGRARVGRFSAATSADALVRVLTGVLDHT